MGCLWRVLSRTVEPSDQVLNPSLTIRWEMFAEDVGWNWQDSQRLIEILLAGWHWLDEGSPGEGKSHLLGLHFVVESLIFTNTLDGGLVGASKETNAVLLFNRWDSWDSERTGSHPEPPSKEVELRREPRSLCVQIRCSFYFTRDCQLPYGSTSSGLCF